MISVVIPNRNKGDLVWKCLDSLLNQTEKPHQIIFVDDASTDKSFLMAAGFSSHFPEITLVRIPVQKGPQHCRNIGMKFATGDYIFISDSDCEYPPQLLEDVEVEARE